VTGSSGNIWLAKEDVFGVNAPLGWFNVTVIFGVTTPAKNVEFRGYAVGRDVYLDYLVVEQLSPQPVSCTELAFRPGDLFKPWKLIPYNGTSLNGAIMSNGTGTFWRGPIPYASLPKGNYIAKFWLKLDKSYDSPLTDPLMDLNVTSYSLGSLGRQTVYGLNFKEKDAWQSIEVKFVLPDDLKDIEFVGENVRQSAPDKLSFLYVEVHTDTKGLL
jgi:hypothetical protein